MAKKKVKKKVKKKMKKKVSNKRVKRRNIAKRKKNEVSRFDKMISDNVSFSEGDSR